MPRGDTREQAVEELVAASEEAERLGGRFADDERAAELAEVAVADHAGVERDEVAGGDGSVPGGALPGDIARRDPRHVLRRRSGHTEQRHRLHEHTGQLAFSDAGRERVERHRERPLGNVDRRSDRVDLGVELRAPSAAQQFLAVDDPCRRKRLGEHGCGRWGERVRGDRSCRCGTFDIAQHAEERLGVERDAVEMFAGDVVGHAFVPGTEQMDRPAVTHQDAARAERPRSCRP